MRNPLTYLVTKFNELDNGFNGWLAQQSLPVEVAVATLTSAAFGAAAGGFSATFKKKDASKSPAAQPSGVSLDPKTVGSFSQSKAPAGGPLIHARNIDVMTGVNEGISRVMIRLRAKEDVQTSMVAAFGSGVMFSLVSGSAGPNRVTNVITSGIFFALCEGLIFKVCEKFSVSPRRRLVIHYHVERNNEVKEVGKEI